MDINKMTVKEKFQYLLYTDFPTFLEYTYGFLNFDTPTPLQTRIAEIIAGKDNKTEDRLILEAARGTGKSLILTIFCAWKLLRNNNEKIMIVSATSGLAERNSRLLRNLFENVPILKHLDPSKTSLDNVQSWNVYGADVNITPSVTTVGISGQIVGRRASLVVADDIEINVNSATEDMRQKLLHKVKEFEAILIPDQPSSCIFLGTPQSIESVYNKLDYKTVILPAQVPEDISIYEGKLDPWILNQGLPGEAVDKIRFPEEELLFRKANTGLAYYRLQYLLDTTLSDQQKYPLKLSDLITHSFTYEAVPNNIAYASDSQYHINELTNIGFSGDGFRRPLMVSKEYEEFDFKVMSIDPAGKGGKDETTWAILGVKNGLVFVLDVSGTFEGYSRKGLTILASKAKEYEVNEIIIEKNWGDGMFRSLFEPILAQIYPCTLTDISSTGQKEVRIINTVEPLTTNHKIVISRELVERDIREAISHNDKTVYSFLYQFTRLTRDRGCLIHDDKIDAFGMACEYVKHMVMVSPEEMLNRVKEREFDDWLNDKIYSKQSNNSNRIISTAMNRFNRGR